MSDEIRPLVPPKGQKPVDGQQQTESQKSAEGQKPSDGQQQAEGQKSAEGQKDVGVMLTKRKFLENMNSHEIAKVFTRFEGEKRTLIIPIGFPQAGKSLLLSSLMYYAVKGENKLFKVQIENSFPYDWGRKTADNMITFFEQGKLYNITVSGTLDLIGIKIEPNNKKRSELNLGFLDLSGEDIQKIKTSGEAVFTEKINAVFNGLNVNKSPVIFMLITPYIPSTRNDETIEEAHKREDTLHFDFLNYIKQNQLRMFMNSKIFVIVSQWDKNPAQSQDVESFIKEKRPSVYNCVKDTGVVWGHYSIGRLLESEVGGINMQEIVKIDSEYPASLWGALYYICMKKKLGDGLILDIMKKLFGI